MSNIPNYSILDNFFDIGIFRVRLVHWMWITTEMVIFITENKMCCNGITKLIH